MRLHPLAFPCLVIIVFVLGCANPDRYKPGNGNQSLPAATPPLELLSYHGTRSYNYLIVEGQVRNATGERLDRIMAVVETYDSAGNLVTSEDGVLEYQPLMPGQASPFKVMIRDNPAISTFKVGFKEMFGGLIPYTDLSPRQQPPASKKKKK